MTSLFPRFLALAARRSCIRSNGSGFYHLFRSGMCSSSAEASEAEPSSEERAVVIDGIEKFLYSWKKLALEDAQAIAGNVSTTVEQVLKSMKQAHGECSPGVISENIGAHLKKMHLDTIFLFFESLGMDVSNEKRKVLLRNRYHHVVGLATILMDLGVERKTVGSMLEQNRFMLEGDSATVINLVQYLQSNNLSKESFQVLCSKFPDIFTSNMKSDWEPFMQVLRDYEIQEPALRRLVKHFGFLLVQLPQLEYARTLSYFQVVINLEKADISRILKSHPECLLMDLDKTIKSKVEFLKKNNVKQENIARVFTRCPGIVGYGIDTLNKKIEYLRSIGIKEHSVKKILIRFPAILAHSIEGKMKPTVTLLENAGICGDDLGRLLVKRPAIFALDTKDRLPGILDSVKELGPEGVTLVLSWGLSEGFRPMKARIRYLKGLGFSSEELVRMLSRDPRILKISLAGLDVKVRYLTEEMGFSKESLVGNPTFLYSHFERRIKLRYEVLKLLHEKGALTREPQLSQILYPDNKAFMERYVNPYRECVKLVKKHYRMFQRKPEGDHHFMMKYIDGGLQKPTLEGEGLGGDY